MVKAKAPTKPHSASTPNRAKKNHNKAASSSKLAVEKQQRKAVDPTTLAWSTVYLPSEAQSGGAGVTESDFFNTLNWNDDDFMGLQEIDDVDVLQQTRPDGSRTISFLASDNKLKNKQNNRIPATSSSNTTSTDATKQSQKQKQKAKKNNNKRSIEEVVSDAEPETTQDLPDARTGGDETNLTPEAQDGESNDEYETAADVTMVAAEDDHDDSDLDLDDDDLAEAFRNAHHLDLQDDEDDQDDADFDDKLLPAWSHLPLHGAMKRALVHKNFIQPTEIQNRTLPLALGLQQEAASSSDDSDHEAQVQAGSASGSKHKKRDIVGVSQTGSGKTLAYGLPILNYLFENAENAIASSSRLRASDDVPPPLGALILCPTRELALQVSSHLTDLVRASCLVSAQDNEIGISHKKLLRRPQIAVVCGGMSEQKQRRLLQGRSRQAGQSGVDIIVATPGRLWEMTRLDDHLAARIKQTRFLVLDEADRMVEVGHFAEMEHILNLVNRAQARRPAEGKDGQQADSGSEVESEGVKPSSNMQTFIFSATLSKALQVNLKRRRKIKQFTKKRHSKTKQNATTLDELMDRIDFRSSPAIIDLTPSQGLPSGLMETKIECVGKDKDLYLYYFLLRYPGRSLVFVNSIDGIRRLTPILGLLNIRCYPIHSQLQQKQRLKNLDRFRTSTNCVLVATDVAARGLDIPSVEHVVHYQLPRSADTYVHRSGRTARAGTSGVSLVLIEPKEKQLWSKIGKTLSRKDIPTFPITFSTIALLRERVELALEIDKTTHKENKKVHDENWLAKLAEEADLDFSDEDLDPDAPTVTKRKGGEKKGKLNEMKAKLTELLRRPITTKGLSHRYLTAGGLQASGWVDDMISNKSHESILGVAKAGAGEELMARQITPLRKKQKKEKEGEERNKELTAGKKTVEGKKTGKEGGKKKLQK